MSLRSVEAKNSVDFCLTREGQISVIGTEITALYEGKLFVTADELARYVFLTNANDTGDHSVAVYRRRAKAGSAIDEYWLTCTSVSTSLVAGLSAAKENRPWVDSRTLKVRRLDAQLPETTAHIIHELWLAMLERAQVDERAVPSAPTAIIYGTTARGVRVKAVTVGLDKNSVCLELMRFGLLLKNYAETPSPARARLARKIESESRHLLEVSRKRR